MIVCKMQAAQWHVTCTSSDNLLTLLQSKAKRRLRISLDSLSLAEYVGAIQVPGGVRTAAKGCVQVVPLRGARYGRYMPAACVAVTGTEEEGRGNGGVERFLGG